MFNSSITSNSQNYWLFGNNFMRGFYSVFDMDNKKFGFAPLVGSTKTAPGLALAYGGTPTKALPENLASPSATGSTDTKPNEPEQFARKDTFEWGWIILGLGVAVVIVVVIVLVCQGEERAAIEAEGARARKEY